MKRRRCASRCSFGCYNFLNRQQNAIKNNVQILNGVDIKKNDFTITGLGKSRETVRWVYDNKVGTVSEPTEIGDAYVVAIITSIGEKGTMGVAEARPLVEGLVRNQAKAKRNCRITT